MTPDEQITREILGNVPTWLSTVFYTCEFAALAAAAWLFSRQGRWTTTRSAIWHRQADLSSPFSALAVV